MKRAAVRIAVATGLVVLGWVAGQATQLPQADFELNVSSPSGSTTITCLRGCGLQFIRYAPDKAKARPSFTYTCSGNSDGHCGGSVQGWLLR